MQYCSMWPKSGQIFSYTAHLSAIAQAYLVAIIISLRNTARRDTWPLWLGTKTFEHVKQLSYLSYIWLNPYGELRRTSSLISAFATESHEIGFPSGGDSAIFWGKRTEVSLLSRDKRITGQGWDARWVNHYFSVKIRDGTRDVGYETGRRTGRGAGHKTGRKTGRGTELATLFFFL